MRDEDLDDRASRARGMRDGAPSLAVIPVAAHPFTVSDKAVLAGEPNPPKGPKLPNDVPPHPWSPQQTLARNVDGCWLLISGRAASDPGFPSFEAAIAFVNADASRARGATVTICYAQVPPAASQSQLGEKR